MDTQLQAAWVVSDSYRLKPHDGRWCVYQVYPRYFYRIGFPLHTSRFLFPEPVPALWCSLITCIFGARGVHSPQRHLSSYSRLGPVGLWYLLQRLPQRVGLAIAERSPTLDRPASDIDPPRQMPPDGPCLVVLWLQRRPPSGVQPSLLGRVSPGRRITIYQRRNGAVTHPRPLRNLWCLTFVISRERVCPSHPTGVDNLNLTPT